MEMRKTGRKREVLEEDNTKRDRKRQRETRGGDHCQTHSFTAKDTNKQTQESDGGQ